MSKAECRSSLLGTYYMLDGRAFNYLTQIQQINSVESWVWWRVLGTRADSTVNLAIKFTGEMVKAQISRDIWKGFFSLVLDLRKMN